MTTSLEHLQTLLRDLFQFDLSDLDFGIYRLLRLKRAEIEAFLTEQLPQQVNDAFAGALLEDQKRLNDELSELEEKIKQDIDEGAISATGEIQPEFRYLKGKKDRKLISDYEEKKRAVKGVQATEEQRAEVFNHLYTFFSRYYEDGDFIPKRRYGARETYAVPYDGEETYFHWANKDQHYVKSGEHFKDYSFTVEAMGKTYKVRFALTDANLPPGNAKGDTRYFFPQPDRAVFEKNTLTFTLPFHYRLPTEDEIAKQGKNGKFQEALLDKVLKDILKGLPDEALRGSLNEIVDKKGDEQTTFLLKRLRHFCRRNTTDFFVHKNLEGFLKGELEFYIKDQILNIADLEADFASKRRMLKVVRELAGEVIRFLAQIENVQKRLFEKKKFVLRTDYLIPIQNVPKELWKEVIQNEAQLEEWKKLYAIDPKDTLFTEKGKVNEDFLSEYPTLVVNTVLFDESFTLKALSAFDDIDEATDGLLVNAENYQALKLLHNKYAGAIDCVHIDPPYNTDASGFLYKNRFRHSTWLTMMEERINEAISQLSSDGVFMCHIDENECERLRLMLDEKPFEYIGTAIWDKLNPMMGASDLAVQHEYIVLASIDALTFLIRPENIRAILAAAQSIVKKHGAVTDQAKSDFSAFVKSMPNLSGGERAYHYLESNGSVYRLVAMTWPNPNPAPPEFFEPLIHPLTGKPCPVPGRGWSQSPRKMKQLIDKGHVVFGPDETTQPQRKIYLSEEKALASVIEDGSRGRNDLDELGLSFTYSHPVSLYQTLLDAGIPWEQLSTTIDFFAGSGTTAHAIISLNRQDGRCRKFILIEMAEYFETVLLPRLKKVIFCLDWKAGKPVRHATKKQAENSPRLIKVLRLESYEDTLHNLTTAEAIKREAVLAKAHKEKLGVPSCRLNYMLKLPMQASGTLLNLEKLEHPFKYTIEVLTEDGPKTQSVDLLETFNYLHPIDVRRIETWTNDKDDRLYRVIKGKNREGRSVLVLWRDMEGLDPKIERAFLESRLKTETPFDEMLINGDSATPGFKSLDPIFKRLIEEEER